MASSIRRKRSSSQPATRTLPRLPGKQSLEADLQFVPGNGLDLGFNSLRRKELFKKVDKKDKKVEPKAEPKQSKNDKGSSSHEPLKSEKPGKATNPLTSEWTAGKRTLQDLHQRRLMLSTYRHVPQPEPPPPSSLLPVMFGLTDAPFDVVDNVGVGADMERPTSIGCYAASSSSSEISQSNSVEIDPTWSSVIRKYSQVSSLSFLG